jgi:hypothetical protein
VISAAALFMAGCAPHYYAPPPPPPPNAVPALIQRADYEGFRTGRDDGARDAYNGTGYHPQHDRKVHDTPGYDPALGPYGPYRDSFRRAYLRGYDQGFHRR